MNIVIEGPDNSGKSTLVDMLAIMLQLPIIRGKGPCRDDEFRERFLAYLTTRGTICDRHHCVSEPIYAPILRGADVRSYTPTLQRFYDMPHVFVYCRNTRGLEGHVTDHARDTPEHLGKLTLHHTLICEAYDRWALQHAHFIYRIGDDVPQLVRALSGAFGRLPMRTAVARR